jgi:hypothetical protein
VYTFKAEAKREKIEALGATAVVDQPAALIGAVLAATSY